MRINFLGFAVLSITVMAGLISGCSTSQSNSSTETAKNSVNAQSLKNTIPPTPKSIEAGKRLYDRMCADCHGSKGDGVSETATMLVKSGKIPPSDLTDDVWDLGSTDGEIFLVIRDGSGSNLAMKGLNGRPGIVDEDIWNLVNYVRSLHK